MLIRPPISLSLSCPSTVYAASLTAKQHAFGQNGLGALIGASPQLFNNRNYSKSIISTGNNGSNTNDTTNNGRNIPKNLSNSGNDKYTGSGKQSGGGGNKDNGLPCPKCGHPKCVSVDLAGSCFDGALASFSIPPPYKLITYKLITINRFLIAFSNCLPFQLCVSLLASTRFVQCDKCRHLFVLLMNEDGKKILRDHHINTDKFTNNLHAKKPPPPPKKIFEYLNQHVIGQDHAKKVLSVAVYNHYKRIYNNAPASKSYPTDPQIAESHTHGTHRNRFTGRLTDRGK